MVALGLFLPGLLRAQEALPGGAESAAGNALPAAEATPGRRVLAARPMLSPGEYISFATSLRGEYRKLPAEWPTATIDQGVAFLEIGKLPAFEFPKDNPDSQAKERLGEMLFFEPRLSGSGQISCANCHDPDLHFADGRTVAFGHNRHLSKRNTPTLINVRQNTSFFWDGRADSLEDQARQVILNPAEMHGSEEQTVERLRALPDYVARFSEAFGSEEITLARVTQAIATFERTLSSRRNAFDRFLDGESEALTDSAIRGLHLFRTTARCVNCHFGPNFTDGQFHNLGLSFYGRKLEDLGRYAVTQRTEDVGAFKTPTLRNVSHTAPYMHNGLFDLDGVLRLYNAGMPTLRRSVAQKEDPLFPVKDRLLTPLSLNAQDLADLKAFLESLSDAPRRFYRPNCRHSPSHSRQP